MTAMKNDCKKIIMADLAVFILCVYRTGSPENSAKVGRWENRLSDANMNQP